MLLVYYIFVFIITGMWLLTEIESNKDLGIFETISPYWKILTCSKTNFSSNIIEIEIV